MFPRHPVGEGLAPPAMSREWPWIAVGAGPRPARPPRTMTPVGRGDPARRLTGFRPAGRPPLPTAAKEAKRRRGRLTSPSGTGSLRLQFVLPRTPGIYGSPIPGGDWSLSGAGWTTTAPASATLPLLARNQDGLVCWTKQARLIAQGLISADVNWRAGQGPAPTGQFRSWAIRWPPQP